MKTLPFPHLLQNLDPFFSSSIFFPYFVLCHMSDKVANQLENEIDIDHFPHHSSNKFQWKDHNIVDFPFKVKKKKKKSSSQV